MTPSDKRDCLWIVLYTAVFSVVLCVVSAFWVKPQAQVTVHTHPPHYALTVLPTVPAPTTTTTVKPKPAPTTAPVTQPPVTSPPPPVTAPPITQPASHIDGPDYHTWWDWPLWHALGICEEGIGPPPDGILWTKDSTYVSGFGMARSTFNEDAQAIGLPAYYLGYSIPDQIRVAREGHYVRHQFWGCGPRVPGW